jgi:hypothetical protein
MALGMLPVIGVPLPLMSAGLSSVLATSTAIGFAISVRLRRFVNWSGPTGFALWLAFGCALGYTHARLVLFGPGEFFIGHGAHQRLPLQGLYQALRRTGHQVLRIVEVYGEAIPFEMY